MLVGEAVIIGLLATVVGIGLGILVAVGLKSLFNAIGFGLPSANTVLAPRTFIAAAVIGIGVTLVSALAPARRAGLIPPVEAMRAGFVMPSGSLPAVGSSSAWC